MSSTITGGPVVWRRVPAQVLASKTITRTVYTALMKETKEL